MKLHKDKNHSHYWTESCVVYESYSTIRGIRYRALGIVLFPDVERLSEEQIKSVEEQLNEYKE